MPTTTTKTKCPVCKEEFSGEGTTVSAQGTSMKVCSEECAQEVRSDPTKFAKGRPNP